MSYHPTKISLDEAHSVIISMNFEKWRNDDDFREC